MNARIADLIQEARADEIHEAIAEGAYFKMQTFTQALIDFVLAGKVEREVAANAATNRHDFLVALDRALKEQAAAAAAEAAEEPEAATGPAQLRVAPLIEP